MAKKSKTYNEMVEVLEANRKSQMTGVGPRDSDNELFIQILQIHRKAGFSAEQLDIMRGINFESIRRSRQKLQAASEYIPDSPEVAKKRRLKCYDMEMNAGKDSAAGVQHRVERKI